jgi:hypothetical protein
MWFYDLFSDGNLLVEAQSPSNNASFSQIGMNKKFKAFVD